MVDDVISGAFNFFRSTIIKLNWGWAKRRFKSTTQTQVKKMNPLLDIQDLKTYFFTSYGAIRALDGVSLKIYENDAVGLVGESGSGKTVTALSIMGLVPEPGRIIHGKILFRGQNLLELTEKSRRKIRGKNIAMGFQDPMTYLNPVMRVGYQIAESITLHQGIDKSGALEKAIELMDLMRIPSANEVSMSYPHQLSGGMRQRVLIAMALSCNPDLLIVDEPTTALDIIVGVQIIELLNELRRKLNTSLLLITHDLRVVKQLCEKMAVMYFGNIVEYGNTQKIFKKPLHPYTEALLRSFVRIDEKKDEPLKTIKGWIFDPLNPPTGCKFHPRCQYAKDICKKQLPDLIEIEPEHYSACIRVEEIMEFMKE